MPGKRLPSDFTGNTGNILGGALYTRSATLTVTGSTFVSNKVVDLNGGIYGDGGAIAFVPGVTNTASATIKDTLFQDNSANSYGGAIFFDGATLVDHSITLEGVTMLRNTAYEGGALYGKEFTTVNMVNNTLVANKAGNSYAGGSLSINAANVFLINNLMVGNASGGMFQDIAGNAWYYQAYNVFGSSLSVDSTNKINIKLADVFGTSNEADLVVDENNLLQVVVTDANKSYLNRQGFMLAHFDDYGTTRYAWHTEGSSAWTGYDTYGDIVSVYESDIFDPIWKDATGGYRIGTYTTGAAQHDPSVAFSVDGVELVNYGRLSDVQVAVRMQASDVKAYTRDALLEAMKFGNTFYLMSETYDFGSTIVTRADNVFYGNNTILTNADGNDIFELRGGSLKLVTMTLNGDITVLLAVEHTVRTVAVCQLGHRHITDNTC